MNDHSGPRDAYASQDQSPGSGNRSLDDVVEAHAVPARASAVGPEEHARAWNNAPDLLSVAGPDARFHSVNAAWSRQLGWQPDELAGQSIFAVAHPDDAESARAAFEAVTLGHMPYHENRVRHADGSYRWFAWAAAQVGDRIYACGRHITPEKQAAAAQARSEEHIRHTQKMEAIGQLTGGIAHDFNNLLQAISGALELLASRHVDSEEGHRLIRQAASAVDRGATLTRQLLAFAREQQLAPRPIDINATLSDSCELISRSFGASAVIEWQLGEAIWPAMADPNQLDIALLNLLLNARDAMPDGGIITVATRNMPAAAQPAGEWAHGELAPGDYVRLAVTDTGGGMSEAVRARAFEPFYTTKEVGRGSGLGLSQVYGFARQSGGAARIISAPGQGTTVEIILPRAAAADTRPAPAPVTLHRAATVLVVDDDADVREQTAASLEDCGYRVLEADGGPGALRLLADHPVDLLLVDYAMPGMNGAEVVRLGRFMQPAVKVLFMTGYADIDALRAYASPGDIIRKPFRLGALTGHVEKLLRSEA